MGGGLFRRYCYLWNISSVSSFLLSLCCFQYLFHSERMEFVELVMNREVAKDSVKALGDFSKLHFIDVRRDHCLMHCPFTAEEQIFPLNNYITHAHLR
jgi:hypothetical protein